MKYSKKNILRFILSVFFLVIILLYKLGSTKSTYRLTQPISVYITWGAHDNLSDTILLSEYLVFKQLNAIRALKKYGAHFDYFVLTSVRLLTI